MHISAFFRLIRWKNLLFIIYAQILIKFLFFPVFNIATNLSIFQFSIFLLGVILISAAGYIINNIEDLKTDLVNAAEKVVVSKQISIDSAKRLYLILNTFGIVFGLGLCLNIQKPSFSFIFIGTSLLLYYYSKKLKSKALIGNITVSLLIAVSMLLLGLLDVNQTFQNGTQSFALTVLFYLACFAFLLNLIRERH